MRALFCAAAFVLSLVPAFPETVTQSSPVTLVYRFTGPTPEFVLQGIKDEIRVLMGPSSLRLEWQNRAEITNSDTFENLVVVDFHGRCRTRPSDPVKSQGQTLGRAQVVDGMVLPFVEIECGRVEAFLHSALWRQNQKSDLALGRALARVLAHELYHVLAGTTSHSRSGIAKPELSGSDLISNRLEFEPSDVDRMKSPQERSSPVRLARQDLRFVP